MLRTSEKLDLIESTCTESGGTTAAMKRIAMLAGIVWVTTAFTPLLGQQTQSMSFFGPSTWNPGTTVNVDVFLMFSGYSAIGLSYWLEVPDALAPYLSVTSVSYFTFSKANNTTPNPAPFNST